jgi:shikimate 5-dehydrogenase
MPLKAEILKHLDEISPESYATGACNTVVRVPREDGSIKLVGTNTDFLGKSRLHYVGQRGLSLNLYSPSV